MDDFITTCEVSRPVEMIEDPDFEYDDSGTDEKYDRVSRLFASIASLAIVLAAGMIFAVILYLFMWIY